MSLRWTVVAVTAIACRTGAVAPAPHVTPEPVLPPPENPACIAPGDEATGITDAQAVGSSVQYCVGGDPGKCFALDVETAAFARLPGPPRLAHQPGARVEAISPELKVCTRDVCEAMTAKVLPGLSSIRGATNPIGSMAVFLLGDAASGKGYAEIWNVANRKKVATFRYARGEFRCGDVAMLDNTIYLATRTCDAPTGRAALYSLTGKRIAYVGGRDFGMFGDAYVRLDGRLWAFLEENGDRLVLQDTAKGKLVKTIDLSALFGEGGSEIGNPGESALVALGSGKLAVIGGAPVTGHVATIDIATGDVKVVRAKRCGT